ncbi:MAG: hypothetical protein A3G87_07250 [Omnitrophica bacterium RIFCSPLOWO2_12_FULL_50_11]|nr:MAG: hypothetical protein A3G87_07250 [Omnitrophica bacterium RIFCSPLOWO2_12_FULL_50_11]
MARLEAALDRVLPPADQNPAVLHEAMRYSVLDGGKRIRPLLAMAVCDMFGGDSEQILIPACSIELIHSYSLIHDDLPCMDNDEWRRGQLTCHKKYGEAMALLAGDGLLTLAFHLLGKLQDERKGQRLTRELAQAAGTFGMVGGQAMDLISGSLEMNLPTLDAIHINKTGQMIRVSGMVGAIMGGANQDAETRILKFGEYLGFAFQIVDDILDRNGYLHFMSAHKAREKASDLITKAKKELSSFKMNQRLLEMADWIGNRTT